MMTHMTNADYQKRLLDILESVRKGGYYDGVPDERVPDYLDKDVAAQALTALCRDVCGEVLGKPRHTIYCTKQPNCDCPYAYENEFKTDRYKKLETILGQPQEDKR